MFCFHVFLMFFKLLTLCVLSSLYFVSWPCLTCWLVDLFKLTFRDEFLTSSFDNFCANCGIDACYLFLCLVWVLSLCIDYDLTLMWHLSQGCSSTYMHTPLPAHVWIEFVFLKWFVRGFFLCMFVCFDWWIGTFYTVLYVY